MEQQHFIEDAFGSAGNKGEKQLKEGSKCQLVWFWYVFTIFCILLNGLISFSFYFKDVRIKNI